MYFIREDFGKLSCLQSIKKIENFSLKFKLVLVSDAKLGFFLNLDLS